MTAIALGISASAAGSLGVRIGMLGSKAYGDTAVIVKDDDSAALTLTMATNGDLTISGDHGGVSGDSPGADEWLVGNPDATEAANWSVRATLNSGTLDSGTTGSWLALTSARSWEVDLVVGSGGRSQSANLDFEFSRDGGTTVHAEATNVTIEAEVN